MLAKLLGKIMGDSNQKEINQLWPLVKLINQKEEEYQKLSEAELKAKTEEFKNKIKAGVASLAREKEQLENKLEEAERACRYEEAGELNLKIKECKEIILKKEEELLEGLLIEAFAAVKNACRRLLGKKWLIRGREMIWEILPYDEQLLGGIVLHRGKIAEMKTGEGKTFAAIAPMYLNALSSRGTHVVTVNDYLAQRDAEWVGEVYRFLGLSVGVIIHGLNVAERRQAYACEITYGTNNEFGFDYLRDNMAVELEHVVQRELHYAIVDECDSILIDEARTPLIISAPFEEAVSKYRQYAQLILLLQENVHYNIDEKLKTATLTEEGIKKMEELLSVENIYTEKGVQEVHHIEQALRAHTVYKKEVDYVVKDGEILIVDEFTGRLMPGRRFSEGLHQALEAKEGVQVQRESKTLATITFQNYFRLFHKIAGMTGTAVTEAEEFSKIYKLETIVIPTHKPCIRADKPDMIFKTEEAKFNAVLENVKEKHARGQPVLIGTISIEKSELLADLFKRSGIPHDVLNAKHHEKEAEIVARAGEKGRVAIATNMAGRGTDIKLGEGVVETGGLAILGTERHESRRIDNQLRGRSGRQGDPGESQFFLSMGDDLMRIFGGEKMKGLMDTLKVPDDLPIENRMISHSIESAQKRVEGYHFDTRKHVLEYDDVMNKHRGIIYGRRRRILEKENLKADILELIQKEAEGIVLNQTGSNDRAEWNFEEIYETARALGIGLNEQEKEQFSALPTKEEVASSLQNLFLTRYTEKEKTLPDPRILRSVEKNVYLRSIDLLWMEHIDNMMYLREQVALRGYAQLDPLIEYKRESYILFQKLLNAIATNTVSILFKIEIETILPSQILARAPEINQLQTNAEEIEGVIESANLEKEEGVVTPVKVVKANETVTREGPKVGRNDPCPCGAKRLDGTPKKYKNCCGKEE
ncbi:preprotein translocase subunit SecA [Candidatus Peregrinibacteria bacterium CG08_land_8_20_14_0_20_41_10]|nr:MAG: preprotein translocase subunit SecA [Candidatus Peregrinibacteria bacterium CG08_land_8_20_14_0_20_41_10]